MSKQRNRALSAQEIAAIRQGRGPNDALAAWDFSIDIESDRISDTSSRKLHGRTVNLPMRAVTGHNWNSLEMDYKRARAQYGAIYFHDDDIEDAKWEAGPEFRAPANRLSFASRFLAFPIAKADPSLCVLLDRHAEELLAKFPPRNSLVDQVRSIITGELRGGDPSLERVADQLGFTPRTLQRKLQELGASHNELLDQMRRQLAMRYLREREMAICEVAYLLGFSESSSFHRAFKRWTGVTPKEFRK